MLLTLFRQFGLAAAAPASACISVGVARVTALSRAAQAVTGVGNDVAAVTGVASGADAATDATGATGAQTVIRSRVGRC